MYINSFLTELSKKIDTVGVQLKDFEGKINVINEVKNIITLRTLKDIDDLTGADLVLLSKEEFAQILQVFKFDNQEEKIKIFFNASVAIKVNQKFVSDGEETFRYENVDNYIKWLNEQVKYIKEYIKDFNDNNKEYYNSLKVSDSLYKKYLGYFKNDKLIKPIYNIEEFNEVVKKSGIIMSEKWQLLKYVAEKNIDFHKKNESNNKDNIEYSDEEILNFVENILKRENILLNNINDDLIKKSLNVIEASDEEVSQMDLSGNDVVKLQKIPIIDTMKKIYLDTKDLLKNDLDKDALKIEKNLKKLMELVESYDVLKKIES